MTGPAPSAEAAAVRDAMTQLARLWEAAADNLEHAIDAGASRHSSEVETLRRCASELCLTLRARRPGAQSAGADPVSAEPESDTTALHEAARRLRAGGDACGDPGSFHATKLRSVADTFAAWAETEYDDHPYQEVIAAAARVILGSADS